MFRRLIVRFFALSPPAADDQIVTGVADVIDGDTIVVAGEVVRLHGMDAPELGQAFWWRKRRLDGGAMAMAALEALTAGIKLKCVPVERDRHGRLVAKCFTPNGIDIGRRMVLTGWALAYRYYSRDYVDAERIARKLRRGLWKGSFAKPWEFRAMATKG